MRSVIAALCLLLLTSCADARPVRHHYAWSDARPTAWCGWFMRHQVGVDPGPAYNLARNWAHYGRAAWGPAVGAIVVWPHHVGRIVARAASGLWVVLSGNDGHAVRTRPRRLDGAIAYRWA